MGQFNRPEKTLVRAWMLLRRRSAAPPPDMEEIRRALGWTGPGQTPFALAAPALPGGQNLNTRKAS